MKYKHLTLCVILILLILLPAVCAFAQPLTLPNVSLNIGGTADAG